MTQNKLILSTNQGVSWTDVTFDSVSWTDVSFSSVSWTNIAYPILLDYTVLKGVAIGGLPSGSGG